MAIIILVFVKSTAVIIALIISSFTFLILFKKHLIKKYIVRTLVLLVLSSLISYIYLSYLNKENRIKNKISTFIDYRSTARLVLYQSTLKLIKDNLILGVGPGNWKIKCQEYGLYSASEIDETYYKGVNFAQRPHNDFLWVFAEAGIFAGLCYIILFLILLKESYLLYRKNNEKERKKTFCQKEEE